MGTYDLKHVLDINEADLNGQMTRQPALVNFYARKSAQLESEADNQKDQLEYIRAKLYEKIRYQLTVSGDKFSEAMIANRILMRKKYRKELKKYQELKRLSKIAVGALKAVLSRGSMLEQLSFNKRKEMDYILSYGPKKPRKK